MHREGPVGIEHILGIIREISNPRPTLNVFGENHSGNIVSRSIEQLRELVESQDPRGAIGFTAAYDWFVQRAFDQAYYLDREKWAEVVTTAHNAFEKSIVRVEDRRAPAMVGIIKMALSLYGELNREEQSLVTSGRFSTLYHEGDSDCAMTSLAKKNRMTVVHLDIHNPAYRAIKNVDVNDPMFFELQVEREARWADAIKRSTADDACAIMGKNHAFNKYGLADRLDEKGINMVCNDYSSTPLLREWGEQVCQLEEME